MSSEHHPLFPKQVTCTRKTFLALNCRFVIKHETFLRQSEARLLLSLCQEAPKLVKSVLVGGTMFFYGFVMFHFKAFSLNFLSESLSHLQSVNETKSLHLIAHKHLKI